MDFNSFIRPGDSVVGHFNQAGTAMKKTQLVGDADYIDEKRTVVAAIAMAGGGKPLAMKTAALPPVKKKTKKKEASIEFMELPQIDRGIELPDYNGDEVASRIVPERPIPTRLVTFSNNFGSIKVKVEDVIYSDKGNIMLVFTDAEAISFTPKVGESLQFSEDNKEFALVYFTGDIFTLSDRKKCVIILYKKD